MDSLSFCLSQEVFNSSSIFVVRVRATTIRFVDGLNVKGQVKRGIDHNEYQSRSEYLTFKGQQMLEHVPEDIKDTVI